MLAPMHRIAFAVLIAAWGSFALAQAQSAPSTPAFEPSVGQEGKDVVWVPTPQILVDKMLDMAQVTPEDFVMDLGSGDGRTVITAAKRGINLKLRPRILALKPGTRVVSNSFTMGDWKADETATVVGNCESWCTARLWIVPERVAGTYRIPQGELTLKQEFQMLSGTLRTEGKTFALEGKVRGDEVSFTAGGRKYQGKLNGKQLEVHS